MPKTFCSGRHFIHISDKQIISCISSTMSNDQRLLFFYLKKPTIEMNVNGLEGMHVKNAVLVIDTRYNFYQH